MQEVAQLHAQLAEMEAQRQERAGELQALEAQLQDKVHWHGRFQKRLDQYDLVLKQSRREQWDRKKYKDTLLNMSIEIEVRPPYCCLAVRPELIIVVWHSSWVCLA